VHNAAGWGRDSAWGLGTVERRVLAHDPHVVLVEFSINDADRRRGISLAVSRRNTEAILDRIRAAAPGCRTLLMTMSPALGRHARVRPDLEAYYDLYRRLARERGLALADHLAAWKALDPAALRRSLPDGLHPAPAAACSIILPGLGLTARPSSPAPGR
jgi:lysophospholipase L1-like esterase